MNDLKLISWNEWIEMNDLPKVVQNPSVFYVFFFSKCETELLLQSRAPFAELIFQKCSGRLIFLTILCDLLLDDDVVDIWNRALATVLCTFCRPLSPIEPRNRGNRDPPLATPAATLHEKMQGFAPESVFKPELIHLFPISHTSQLLSWWCGCHDDWPSWWES